MNAAAQQPPQRANERILNGKLEEAVRTYGDLTLQRENIDGRLAETRAYIRSLHGLAPLASEVEEATIEEHRHAAPLPAEAQSIPRIGPAPRPAPKKRGRKSNAEKAAAAAAATLAAAKGGVG